MDSFKDQYHEMSHDIKKCIDMRVDLLKLQTVEKGSKFISGFLVFLIVAIFVCCAIGYLSFAMLFEMESYFGSMTPGCIILAGIFILLAFLVYILRKHIFINPLVRLLGSIMLDDEYIEEEES